MRGGHREVGSLSRVGHIVFDLNLSDQCSKWPEHSNRFDLAVICETIEHLPTAPEFTLLMLSSLLKPGGDIAGHRSERSRIVEKDQDAPGVQSVRTDQVLSAESGALQGIHSVGAQGDGTNVRFGRRGGISRQFLRTGQKNRAQPDPFNARRSGCSLPETCPMSLAHVVPA